MEFLVLCNVNKSSEDLEQATYRTAELAWFEVTACLILIEVDDGVTPGN